MSDSQTAGIGPRPDRVARRARYLEVGEVGRGGMGRVLRAYDTVLCREVALKVVLRRGEGFRRGLVAEARAMARLSHPNVVAVYDVEDSDPCSVVLVMQYVRGATLRRWLDEEPRSWREVIDAFAAAGRGIAAAHAVGILHRDFKPANVLVARSAADSGGRLDVKVTDFGIATSFENESGTSVSDESTGGAQTDPTVPGHAKGTPRYMSPEQFERAPLGPATDQFSFCVALFEALCGIRAYPSGLREGYDARVIGPPPWPEVAVPEPLRHGISRGLARRPEDRWPSMAALVEALSQVTAPRRRRPRWVLPAALVGLGALGWSSAPDAPEPCTGAEAQLRSIWDDDVRRGAEAELEAIEPAHLRRAGARSIAAMDDYVAAWRDAHTEACMATAVRHEQSEPELDLRMACLERARQTLAAVAGVVRHPEPRALTRADTLVDGLPALSMCDDPQALAAAVPPPDPAQAEQVHRARGLLAEAQVARLAGRYDEAAQVLEASEAHLDDSTYEPALLEASIERAFLLDDLGKFDAARAMLQQALRRGLASRQRAAASAAALVLVGISDRLDPGSEVAMRYVQVARGLTLDPRDRAGLQLNAAGIDMSRGRFAAAETGLRAALAGFIAEVGANGGEVAMARNNLAGALCAQGRFPECERQGRLALAVARRRFGEDHSEVLVARTNLAIAAWERGEVESAAAAFAEIVAGYERALGPHHPETVMARLSLGATLEILHRDTEAERELRVVLDEFAHFDAPPFAQMVEAHVGLGNCRQRRGDADAAAAEYRRAVEIAQSHLDPGDDRLAEARTRLHALPGTPL